MEQLLVGEAQLLQLSLLGHGSNGSKCGVLLASCPASQWFLIAPIDYI
jgi:hypothetical protein